MRKKKKTRKGGSRNKSKHTKPPKSKPEKREGKEYKKTEHVSGYIYNI